MTEEEVSELIVSLRQAYLRNCAKLCVRIWDMNHDLPDDFYKKLGILDCYEKDFIHGYARSIQDAQLPGAETKENEDLPLPSNTPSTPETKVPVER